MPQPLTIRAAQKLSDLMTKNDALQRSIASMNSSGKPSIPAITAAQIFLTAAGPEIWDRDVQLGYPRVCIYGGGFKNTQREKFTSLSGTLSLFAELWASGNLLGEPESWIHYYVEAFTDILTKNKGDWGDGVLFPGNFDVQLQPPRSGPRIYANGQSGL